MDQWVWQWTELHLNLGFADICLCKLEAVAQFCRSCCFSQLSNDSDDDKVTGRLPKGSAVLLVFLALELCWTQCSLEHHHQLEAVAIPCEGRPKNSRVTLAVLAREFL